jgi:hypothetical protein
MGRVDWSSPANCRGFFQGRSPSRAEPKPSQSGGMRVGFLLLAVNFAIWLAIYLLVTRLVS